MSIAKPFQFRAKEFEDARGSLKTLPLLECGFTKLHQLNFVQTKANWVRGMHFQAAPWEQAKIIIPIVGKIRDVIVNLQTGQKHVFDLMPGDGLFVPKNYAHGFCSINDSIIQYLLDEAYKPDLGRFVSPFCKELDIDWGVANPVANDRDTNASSWSKRFEAVKSL